MSNNIEPSYSYKFPLNFFYYRIVTTHCLLLYLNKCYSNKTTEYEDFKCEEFFNDVWIPEAIVKAITIVYDCDWIRAEQLFSTLYR